MLRPFSKIEIQQIPTAKWTSRNKNFILDFVTECRIDSGWESHTNNCVVKFPKNISLFGTPDGLFTYNPSCNLILGASGTEESPNIDAFGQPVSYPPLIMKGDIITINYGYIARNNKDQDFYVSTGGIKPLGVDLTNQYISSPSGLNLFFGYVSDIKSGTPIEINCEDNFYLLKRTPFDSTVWNQKTAGETGTSLYGLMQHILDLVNKQFYSNPDNQFEINPTIENGVSIPTFFNPYPFLTLLNIPSSITASFSLGYLDIGDLTCAQVLDKLKTQYHFESTFRDKVLQFGFPIYVESSDTDNPNLIPNSKNFFCFRDIYNSSGNLIASANIFPSHDLQYTNKDDVILTATVQCKIINPVNNGKTKLGVLSTKLSKLKAYIYWDIPTSSFKAIDVSIGNTTPSKKQDNGGEGERHEFFYPVDKSKPNPTFNDLVKLGIEQLKKYHYTGFRGCFKTFGFPFVQWNDNINLLDPIYADRNGQYKVKKVVYENGLKGISQEIHLDYKIDLLNGIPKNTNQIYLM